MGKTDFSVYVLLFLVKAGIGQVVSLPDTVSFSGVVVNARSSEMMPDVNCHFGRNGGSVSDENGCFRIKIRRGDTVVFSHVGFKACRVVIPDTLRGKEYMLGVFMSPDTLMLSETLIIRRWKDTRRQQFANARNNMRGLLEQAYAPREMDAGMNQRMMIDEYARSVEMKGHVDVRFGVGTQSVDAFRWMKMRKRQEEKREWLNPEEIDLLKKLYYLEKREKEDN